MTKFWPWTRRLAALVLVLSGCLFAADAPAAPSSRDAPPAAATASVTTLAKHGFGDSQNDYAWAMAWFKGRLYVGTSRDELCVENATSEYYFPFSNYYTTNPAPGVHCPKNPYDMDLRAEIWQYTPQTGRWRMVYRAPADIPNPRARGKFVARDIAYRGMTVMRDSHGHEALFISGVTADEYIPELAQSHPPRLLRTYDGVHFHDIAAPIVVHYTGAYVDHRAIGFRGLEVWNNRLYVLASTALTGDGEVFEVRHPFAAKAQFIQVTPPGRHVFELQTFDGHLYFGTGSLTAGYGVYETPSTSVPRHTPWKLKPVVTKSAGNPQMISVVSMQVFKGQLYVGATSWWHPATSQFPPAELIRIDRRDQWELVVGDPRKGPDGQWRYPISGLPGGFGNPFNSHFWRMTVQGGALFVGTNDWSWVLQDTKAWAPKYWRLVNRVLEPEFGFDLWKSCDGVSWYPVTTDAFGADPDDFGVRTLVPTSDGFILGTANHAHGTRIWEARGLSSCSGWSGRQVVAARVAAPPAPQSLLTDVQPGGTVLSWERSAGAVKYRVERAQYTEEPLSLRPPTRSPESFSYEDAVPDPVAPGARGSHRLQLPILGSFKALGTTTQLYFVDPTRTPGVRYLYRVVAESESGATSSPSNLQEVPDPRPPATFAQLERVAHGSAEVAALAQVHTGTAGVLARLGQLSRTAGSDQVRELAYRLERRLRYENVAASSARGG
jgi:hypothetical protein